MRIHKKIIMLSLMLFCCVHATREEVMEQLNRELEENGLKLAGGPWYLDDDETLTGMLGHKVLWGKYYRDYRGPNYLKLKAYDKDEKWLFRYCEDDGKRLYENEYEYEDNGNEKRIYGFDEDMVFTFNTPADIRDFAQKLREGKALKHAYVVFYKDSRQFWKPGLENPSILLLDPRDFFFSVDQDIHNLPKLFWTLNEAFYEASASPEKMEDFLKDPKKSEHLKQEEEHRQQKVTREELEVELAKQKAEVSRLEAIITTMGQQIATTRNESAVLKELFSVASKKAEDDKQELHLLLQQTMAVISRQANLLHNTQLILKSLVDHGFGLPPEFMGLLADMHSTGAASSESH